MMARWLASPWLLILLPVLAVKLALAWLLPMTGDEAYFVLWGRHLDYGYYDHPPMAGWMTWLQLLVSDHRVWIRMPGLLTELVIAWALYAFLRRHDAVKARWLALLFMLSPLSLLNVVTLTDTGCILFAALSFLAAAQGLLSGRLRWSLLAGIALGLAFLSKYFAVLLGLGYLVHFLFLQRSAWRHGLVLVLAAIPFGLVNLYWNYTHCWSNLLFNLVNRNAEASGIDLVQLVTYLGMMAYVVLPPVLVGLWQARRQPAAASGELQDVIALARTLALTAFAGFLLLSLRKAIGLHWVLWFHPMLLLLLWPLAVDRLAGITRVVAWISLAHVVLLLTVLLLPLSAWDSKPKLQKDILSAREASAILALAEAEALRLGAPAGLQLATQGYTPSAVLAYQSRRPVMVLGEGSRYARQDDFLTDLRALDGQSVLLLLKREKEAVTAAPWFAESRRLTVQYRGHSFDFLLGRGFDYATYHDRVLTRVREQYYAFPDWLPTGECEFTERYFPQTVVPSAP